VDSSQRSVQKEEGGAKKEDKEKKTLPEEEIKTEGAKQRAWN